MANSIVTSASQKNQSVGDFAAKVVAGGMLMELGKSGGIVIEKTVAAAIPIITANPITATAIATGGISVAGISHALYDGYYEYQTDPKEVHETVEIGDVWKDSSLNPEQKNQRYDEIAQKWDERREAAKDLPTPDKVCVLM
jgi:hypothetical protein